MTGLISSISNPRVKQVRALQSSRAERESAGCFVVEGPTLVQEALQADVRLVEVYHTEQFAADPERDSLLGQCAGEGAHILPVSDEVMRRMADTQTPQGILAVLPLVELPAPGSPSFALVVDAVHDPGNLGTILRLAAGAAVPLVLLTPGTVDIYNPKVVRGAMGAHFALPVLAASWAEVKARLPSNHIFLADSGDGIPHFRADWRQPCALIVSHEAHGPGAEALRLADQHVTIPMPGRTESLNVAMAAGILIYEMLRQRIGAGAYPGA